MVWVWLIKFSLIHKFSQDMTVYLKHIKKRESYLDPLDSLT